MSLIVFLILSALSVTVCPAASDRYLLYRSEDRGRSWSRSDSGLPGDSRINALSATRDAFIAGSDSGIFFSKDSAKTWQKSNLAESNSLRVISLASVNSRLFAGAEGAILSSSDHGQTWQTNATFPRRTVRSLLSVAGALYAGADPAGVYKSSDLGRAWTQLTAGLPPNSQVLSLASVDNQIFAGLYAKGLYRWNDAGQTWVRVGAEAEIKPLLLTVSQQTLIVGHNPGGIFTSGDYGRTWNHWRGEANASFDFSFGPPPVSLDSPVWDLAADHEIVFAGVADGIFYSEDRGRHWTRSRRGLPPVSPGIAFLVRSNLVLAATLTNHERLAADGSSFNGPSKDSDRIGSPKTAPP